MSEESLERHQFVSNMLAEKARTAWETMTVTTAQKFERFLNLLNEYNDGIAYLVTIDADFAAYVRSQSDVVLWISDDEYSDENIAQCLSKLERLGEDLSGKEGLPRALGAHILNEVYRRFQGHLKYPELDTASYAHREKIIAAETRPFYEAWHALETRALAIWLSDPDEDSWRVAVAIGSGPSPFGPVAINAVWKHLRASHTLFGSSVSVDFTLRALQLYQRWEISVSLLNPEAHVWKTLLRRTPANEGWSVYLDVLAALEDRCRQTLDELENSEPDGARIAAVGLSQIALLGYLGAWDLKRAESWITETYLPAVKRLGVQRDEVQTELILAALASKEYPPEELIQHLLGNEDYLGVTCFLLRSMSMGLDPSTIETQLDDIRRVFIGEIDDLVSRSFWPAIDRFNRAVAEGEIEPSARAQQIGNKLARRLLDDGTVPSFSAKSGWSNMQKALSTRSSPA